MLAGQLHPQVAVRVPPRLQYPLLQFSHSTPEYCGSQEQVHVVVSRTPPFLHVRLQF